MLAYLKFADETEAKTVLADWLTPEGEWLSPSLELEFAVRGTMYYNDGVYDEETGEQITPPTPKEGYHIDVIRGELTEAIQAYIVVPTDPVNVLL